MQMTGLASDITCRHDIASTLTTFTESLQVCYDIILSQLHS